MALFMKSRAHRFTNLVTKNASRYWKEPLTPKKRYQFAKHFKVKKIQKKKKKKKKRSGNILFLEDEE